jgi:poly(A) polymerase/tRNA nucleotidyltransferase (CCA-adding enzyme)
MFLLPKEVIYICQTLQKKGFEAYLVGGSLRDLLLGIPAKDFDLATNAKPEQVTKLFDKVIPTGVKYGTVTVMINKKPYEVTTYRQDEEYTDGRRPDKVVFTSDLHVDLSRRDFTINALAYDPLKKELIDLFDGRRDLKKKLIRAVGDPKKRFQEDGLRSIRACRFAAKLNFRIEPKTFQAIAKTLNISKKVSAERVRDELKKILESKQPSIGIENLRKSGLMKIIVPELLKGQKVRQPRPYHHLDVYNHNLAAVDAAAKLVPAENITVRLAALFHDLAKPQCKKGMTFYGHDVQSAKLAEKVMQRLKFSNAEIKKTGNLIINHMFNYTNEWTDAAVRRFIRKVDLENLADLFNLRRADVRAMNESPGTKHLNQLQKRIDRVIAEENALSVGNLALNGNEIMKLLKIGPGPEVGKVLNYLLEKVLEDPALNTEPALTKALTHYAKK